VENQRITNSSIEINDYGEESGFIFFKCTICGEVKRVSLPVEIVRFTKMIKGFRIFHVECENKLKGEWE
jgi:hypothetical protein